MIKKRTKFSTFTELRKCWANIVGQHKQQGVGLKIGVNFKMHTMVCVCVYRIQIDTKQRLGPALQHERPSKHIFNSGAFIYKFRRN